MSHNGNAKESKLFSFLITFAFTLLLSIGTVCSYVKSFLPKVSLLTFLPYAIISAALFSFLLQFKRRKLIFLISLFVIALFVIINRKLLLESAGSTFLPLYASYTGNPAIASDYSFSAPPFLFITVFLVFFSLITASVIIFNLPAVFCLMFPFAVIVVSILFSNEFIDPLSFMTLICATAVILIDRRGLVFAGAGAPKPAAISAVIFLILSFILNAVIKPAAYVQSKNVEKARLSLEDFILDHTGFYVDVNTGNLKFGNESQNVFSWIRDEEYADISGGTLRNNSRTVDRITPPENYPYYIKINEYTDYDGRGWAKGKDTGGNERYVSLLSVPEATGEALSEISDNLSFWIDQRLWVRINDYYSDFDNASSRSKDIEINVETETYERMINYESLIADTIRQYLSNDAAVYDKDISKPPQDVDIADWFLNTSKRGYCIHFATAATLLLRMQGVPARFVTGYLITERPVGNDGKIEVTGNDGHAWCEYLDQSTGLWRILEATPPDPSRASSVSSGQGYGQTDPNINPSGEVDDSDPDDIDDEDEDEEDDEKTDTSDDDSTKPSVNDQDEYNQKLVERAKRTWAAIIVVISLAVAVLLIFFITRSLYRGNLRRGTPKQRIIKYYRAMKLRRSLLGIKVKIPDEIINTVMKARFSSHEMNEEELKAVKSYYESLLSASG